MKRVRTRLGRDGAVWLAASLALALAALSSGNNLVYLVAAPVWVAGLSAWPLGRLQLRGLEVRRELPAELTAGQPAVGTALVRNGRRRLAARGVVVVEVGGDARAAPIDVPAGAVGRARVRYHFPDRGRVQLGRVQLSTDWPFGLFEHVVEHYVPAEFVVYPRPLPGASEPRAHDGTGDEVDPRRVGHGDFLGLRPYREGDPPRSVHWLSSARAGVPLVVEREAEVGDSVRVVVHDVRGVAWERELSRAAGEVGRSVDRGWSVSLVLPGGPPELEGRAQRGASGRRGLLHALAVAEVR